MKRTIKLIIISLVLVLSLSSCELAIKDKGTSKVWYVGFGADYETVHPTGNRLSYTVKDAMEMGKAFKALAKKSGNEFEDIYFLADHQYDLAGNENVHDCYWETYSSTLQSDLNPDDEDVVIFFFSGHGDSKNGIVEEYGEGEAFAGNSILFYGNDGSNNIFDPVCFKDLYTFVNSFKGYKFIICDTCYSGSLVVGDGVSVDKNTYPKTSPISLLFKKDIKASDSCWVLAACTLNQLSTEPDRAPKIWNHGGLTYLTLQALGWNEKSQSLGRIKGASGKILSAGSIADYVCKNGGNYTYEGNMQNVVFGAGSSDLILFKF